MAREKLLEKSTFSSKNGDNLVIFSNGDKEIVHKVLIPVYPDLSGMDIGNGASIIVSGRVSFEHVFRR